LSSLDGWTASHQRKQKIKQKKQKKKSPKANKDARVGEFPIPHKKISPDSQNGNAMIPWFEKKKKNSNQKNLWIVVADFRFPPSERRGPPKIKKDENKADRRESWFRGICVFAGSEAERDRDAEAEPAAALARPALAAVVRVAVAAQKVAVAPRIGKAAPPADHGVLGIWVSYK
jgi:hypothetical protein